MNRKTRFLSLFLRWIAPLGLSVFFLGGAALSEQPDDALELVKTVQGPNTPKSIVHNGEGLFFAQNMMYSHTINVYNRDFDLVKTIPDSIRLSEYGHDEYEGVYKGAPVEAAFSHDGKYAWVSNYNMYGSGFNNHGGDDCSPKDNSDHSYVYRINTETLEIEHVIKVGAVPKFLTATPDNRYVLVSNWCSYDLSIIDTEQNRTIENVSLGRYPRGIAVDSQSEKAYVAVMGSYNIAVVSLQGETPPSGKEGDGNQTERNEPDFDVEWIEKVGRSPRHLNMDPSGRYLYATLNGEGQIAKIDLRDRSVVTKTRTGSAPRSMIISDDGKYLYNVNYNDNTMTKVGTKEMNVIDRKNTKENPIGITYDPKTDRVWVACYSGPIMVFQD